MKKNFLWIGVVALALLGVVMVVSALTVQQLYPPIEEPLVFAHDSKVHQIFEEEQRQREHEEFRVEFQYLTVAALEFTVAAFLAGSALRGK